MSWHLFLITPAPGRLELGARKVVGLQTALSPGVVAFFAPQKTNTWYWGCGSSWATMARPMAMMMATMPSIRSVLLSLAGLRLPAGPWAEATLGPIRSIG